MSNVNDFIGGGADNFIDFSKTIPSESSIEVGKKVFWSGEEDGSYFTADISDLKKYNSSDVEQWAITPADILATYDYFGGIGVYDTVTDTYWVFVFKDTGDLIAFAEIDMLTGSSTVGTPRAASATTAHWYDPRYNHYVDNGTEIGYWNSAAGLYLDIVKTTKVDTDVSGTDQMPADKVLLGDILGSTTAFPFMSFYPDTTRESDTIGATINMLFIFPPDTTTYMFKPFGDYIYYITVGSTWTILGGPTAPMKKVEFYDAINKILKTVGITETVWEV